MRLVTLDDAGAAQPLFVDFVNSLHWYEGMPIELIGTPSDFVVWLAERGLAAQQIDGCLAELHALREHLRGAAGAIARAQPPAAADVDAVSRSLNAATGKLVLLDSHTSSPRLAFETDALDCAYIALRMASSFAAFLEAGDRDRLKLCANPGCGYVFVDTSTNRTRRWCFMRFCGNRVKVRAFRRRRQVQGAGHRSTERNDEGN
jgi:predicted RNA-binding Zn ribbon-like protein